MTVTMVSIQIYAFAFYRLRVRVEFFVIYSFKNLQHKIRITLPIKYLAILCKDGIMRSIISRLYCAKNMTKNAANACNH